LSGDVQWANCATIGNLVTNNWNTAMYSTWTAGSTSQKATANGWNFFKVPKIQAKAKITVGSTWGAPLYLQAYAKFYVNGVLKGVTTTTASTTGNTAANTATLTPVGATKSLTLASASPNNVTIKVKGVWQASSGMVLGTVSAKMLSNAQRNDKTTIMK